MGLSKTSSIYFPDIIRVLSSKAAKGLRNNSVISSEILPVSLIDKRTSEDASLYGEASNNKDVA
jgi:hypothetical protein